ncbi:trypsin-like serine peptidase [Nocardioides sp. J54]|uniref:trypsin-like serine peptidase n=1 Tax=Nocardioides sp. J54 TaxID=935866 RepID=UPI0004BBDEC7|nr:hypothetical protein [Nocardioides sp. J54]
MTRTRTRWLAALSGALLVLPVGLVGPRAAATDPGEPTPGPGTAEVATAADAGAVRSYWTPRRMEAAVPLDLDQDGDPIPADDRSGGRVAAPRSTTLATPRTAGKLFFTTASGDAVCSAASVNTPEKNVVITAGHCVNTGGQRVLLGGCTAGRYFSNFLFVPRYDRGRAPFGSWVGTHVVTHPEWVNRCDDYAHDQALLVVAPRNGRRLVDVVGGNGLAMGFPVQQRDLVVWGWPARSPYDGETARRCAGRTTALDPTGDAFLQCPMNEGASGGPWFVGMVNKNVGYIWAVTSRRTVNRTPAYLVATPLDASVRDLLSTARAARPVAVRANAGMSGPVLTPRAGAVRRPALRKQRTLVGRGQPIRLRARGQARTALVLEVRHSPKKRWVKVATLRTDASGVARWDRRAVRTGDRWYRVRIRQRASLPARVRVASCPLPHQRASAVLRATSCTKPSA